MHHDHWIPQLVESLPWWVKWAFMGGAGAMSAFLPAVLDLSWQKVGVAVGAFLMAISVAGATGHGINAVRTKRGLPRLRLEPFHLIVLGLLIALAGVIWQRYQSSGPIVIVTPAVTQQQAPSQVVGPVTLVPNNLPKQTGSEGEQAFRYIKLQNLIEETRSVKSMIESNAEGIKKQMIKPFLSGSSLMMAQSSWRSQVRRIKEINDLAYSNRPINIETISDPTYLSFPAPGEEALGGNVEKAREYRLFHYLEMSVLKQADALIADMQREKDDLKTKIRSGSAGKLPE